MQVGRLRNIMRYWQQSHHTMNNHFTHLDQHLVNINMRYMRMTFTEWRLAHRIHYAVAAEMQFLHGSLDAERAQKHGKDAELGRGYNFLNMYCPCFLQTTAFLELSWCLVAWISAHEECSLERVPLRGVHSRANG